MGSLEAAVRAGDYGRVRRIARSLRRALGRRRARRDPLLRADLLRGLGAVELLRYEHTGDHRAVERAVALRTRALDLVIHGAVPRPGEPARDATAYALALSGCEHDLAQALHYHYEIDDRAGLLDRAVQLLESARGRVTDETIHTMVDHTLAVVLEKRAAKTSSVPDAHRAVRVYQRLRERVDGDRIDQALMDANLANALATLFELTADRAAVRSAIALGRAAAETVPETDPRAAMLWSNYSSILELTLSHDSDPALVEQALRAARTGLRLAGDDDAGRSAYLLNLVNVLILAHEATGDLDPLDEAIDHARRAVAMLSSGAEGRAATLSSLGIALTGRYEATGDLAVLHEALRYDRLAAAESTPEDAARPGYLNNLAITLITVYEHDRDPLVLDDAERVAEEALAAARGSGADLRLLLQTLGRILFIRYHRTGEAALLDRSTQLDRQALDLLDEDDAGWTETAGNLAADLIAVNQARRDIAALTEAIGLLRRVVGEDPAGEDLAHQERQDSTDRRSPQNHPDRARNLYNLGLARAEAGQGPQGAIAPLRAAADLVSATPMLRAEAAMEWGRVAAAAGDWASAVAGFTRAVELLPLVSPRRLKRPDQERRIGVFDGLARDCAACILASDTPDPARAVELLDRGRGVLLAHLIEANDEVARVRVVDPGLADRFTRLRDALDTDHLVGAAHAAGTRHRQAEELASTITQIRALPGLGDFLTVPTIDTLLTAAADGPVVVVNISVYRCDALILTTGGVRVVPLPLATPAGTTRAAQLYLTGRTGTTRSQTAQVRTVCTWLWAAVAQPVLDAIGFAPRAEDWPRIWWCPTGALGLLPLHAASSWDPARQTETGVLDCAVSSYTATVRALVTVRTRQPVDLGRPLVVALATSTPGEPDLPHVDREVEVVRRVSPVPPVVLSGRSAGRTAVLAALGRHAWLHFAGHSRSAPADRGRGRLRLSDGDLMATEIAALHLDGGQLAYVSSCEGAASEPTVPDEPFNLALALQLAGYRHVVAAARPVGDRTAADVAAAVYQRLAAAGDPEPSATAEALHLVGRRLRRTYPPAVWASYLHVGP